MSGHASRSSSAAGRQSVRRRAEGGGHLSATLSNARPPTPRLMHVRDEEPHEDDDTWNT